MWNKSIVAVFLFLTAVNGQTTSPPAKVQLETPEKDPCADLKCEIGEICVIDDAFKASCQCMDACDSSWSSSKRTLCTTDNATYSHECDLWRNQCYCKKGDKRCGGKEFNNHKAKEDAVIEYYDQCRKLGDLCNWETEKESFALRLAKWFRDLFNLKWSQPMTIGSEDDSLLRPLQAKARTKANDLFNSKPNDNSPNRFASFWFCEMDRNNDGSLTKDELARLSQLLNPSTPCLSSFLTECSGSGKISTADWNKCMKITSEQEQKCADYN